MNTRDYPDWLDCVWLAADRNGQLGAFVTGGSGPIPLSALSAMSFPIEDVEAAVCELPQVSEAHLLVEMVRPDSFVGMAQRGFFVYDWTDVHRTAQELIHVYEQIAVPRNPIVANSLPEPLKRLVAEAVFPDAVFAEELTLDIRAVLECHGAG